MGTMDPALKIKANPSRDGYGDNTRCLRRDVNNNIVTTSLAPAFLAAHITGNNAIGKFQDSLQNDQGGKMAIHSSGHYSIWGDPGGKKTLKIKAWAEECDVAVSQKELEGERNADLLSFFLAGRAETHGLGNRPPCVE
jgi:hypothetical protein